MRYFREILTLLLSILLPLATRAASVSCDLHAVVAAIRQQENGLFLEEKSFARHYPALLPEIAAIEERFLTHFNHGPHLDELKEQLSNPTVKDVVRSAIAHQEEIVQALKDMRKRHKDPELRVILDRTISRLSFNDYRQRKFETRAAKDTRYAERWDPHNRQHHEIWSGAMLWPMGDLGELAIALRSSRVRSQGAQFAVKPGVPDEFIPPDTKILHGRVQHLFNHYRAEVQKSPDPEDWIRTLRAEFPVITQRLVETQRFPNNAKPLQWLEHLERWIGSKEIDLVQELDHGRSRWVEVKNPLRKPELYLREQSNRNFKRAIEQAEEIVEIRRFLGLDADVDLRFVFRTGVDDTTREHLEKLGIEVTSPRPTTTNP